MTSFLSRTEEESFTGRLEENKRTNDTEMRALFMMSGGIKKMKYGLEISEQSGVLEKWSTAATDQTVFKEKNLQQRCKDEKLLL